MRLLTVNLDFEGQKALLVGAGAVGRRKLSTLLEAGATVRVVEPNPAPWLLDLATEGLILLEKAFDPSFLDESPWVFVATNPGQSIMAIVKLAQKKGLWVSLASDPKESNFFQPAVASDEPFRLAVSTGGSSPALAAKVARDLKDAYQGYGALCKLLAQARALILAADLDERTRKRLFQVLAEDPELPALVNQAHGGESEPLKKRLELLLAPVTALGDLFSWVNSWLLKR